VSGDLVQEPLVFCGERWPGARAVVALLALRRAVLGIRVGC